MSKVKEDDPAEAGLTTGIHLVFRGLKFKSDAEIGQKGTFFKGLVSTGSDREGIFKSRCNQEIPLTLPGRIFKVIGGHYPQMGPA